MDNLIFNSNTEETYGFYKDIVRFYQKEIKSAVDRADLDEARDLMDQLDEVQRCADNDDKGDNILVLSMNNGMGFTCKVYEPDKL